MDHIGHYLAQNNQKNMFWAKFGRFWAKNPNLYGKKSGNGDTLGPVELNVWLEQGNQGDQGDRRE